MSEGSGSGGRVVRPCAGRRMRVVVEGRRVRAGGLRRQVLQAEE
jgi:hypothetical protein